jgi:hypothetical protein
MTKHFDRALIDGVIAMADEWDRLSADAQRDALAFIALMAVTPTADVDGELRMVLDAAPMSEARLRAMLGFFDAVVDNAHADQCGAGIDCADEIRHLLR